MSAKIAAGDLVEPILADRHECPAALARVNEPTTGRLTSQTALPATREARLGDPRASTWQFGLARRAEWHLKSTAGLEPVGWQGPRFLAYPRPTDILARPLEHAVERPSPLFAERRPHPPTRSSDSDASSVLARDVAPHDGPRFQAILRTWLIDSLTGPVSALAVSTLEPDIRRRERKAQITCLAFKKRKSRAQALPDAGSQNGQSRMHSGNAGLVDSASSNSFGAALLEVVKRTSSARGQRSTPQGFRRSMDPHVGENLAVNLDAPTWSWPIE